MAHPEIALHPIHGPDGTSALPVGHPMYRAGDEKLPAAWPADFVAEMVDAGMAAKPSSRKAKAISAERASTHGEPVVISTGLAG